MALSLPVLHVGLRREGIVSHPDTSLEGSAKERAFRVFGRWGILSSYEITCVRFCSLRVRPSTGSAGRCACSGSAGSNQDGPAGWV